jgi:hypothetical protein
VDGTTLINPQFMAFSPTAVPEPSSALIQIVLGALGLLAYRTRKIAFFKKDSSLLNNPFSPK